MKKYQPMHKSRQRVSNTYVSKIKSSISKANQQDLNTRNQFDQEVFGELIAAYCASDGAQWRILSIKLGL